MGDLDDLCFSEDSRQVFEDWYARRQVDIDCFNFGMSCTKPFLKDGLSFREIEKRLQVLIDQASNINEDTVIKPGNWPFILRSLYGEYGPHDGLMELLKVKGQEFAQLENTPLSYLIAFCLDEKASSEKRERAANKRKMEEDLERMKPSDRESRSALFASRFESLLTSKGSSIPSKSFVGPVPNAVADDDTNHDAHKSNDDDAPKGDGI